MARRQQETERAVSAVGELVERAVAATMADRSPEPARDTVAMVGRMDERAGEGGAVSMLVTLTLVARLATARDEAADAGRALAWVGEALGPRCRARAAFVSALLVDEDAANDVPRYRDALRGEFLPALIWLVAGVTATSQQ